MSKACLECPLGMRNGGGSKYSCKFWGGTVEGWVILVKIKVGKFIVNVLFVQSQKLKKE